MDPARLRKLLADVRRGRVSTRQALETLAHLPFQPVEAGLVDHHRALRQVLPEVILCQGKTEAQCVGIARAIVSKSGRLLATRASEGQARALLAEFGPAATWSEAARTVVGVLRKMLGWASKEELVTRKDNPVAGMESNLPKKKEGVER